MCRRSTSGASADRRPPTARRLRHDGRVELTTPRLWLRPSAPPTSTPRTPSTPIRRSCGGSATARIARPPRRARRCAGTATRSPRAATASSRWSSARAATSIGDAGLHPLGGRGPDIEVGYTLARSAWGRGYGTEAARALVEHAFAALDAPRVVAQVEPDNLASRHVLEKLGMTERATRIAHGRPHILYGVGRADYVAPPPVADARRGPAPETSGVRGRATRERVELRLRAHLAEDALQARLGRRGRRASSRARDGGVDVARSARASRARRRGSSGGPRGRSAARSAASPRARSGRARSGCGSRGRARTSASRSRPSPARRSYSAARDLSARR